MILKADIRLLIIHHLYMTVEQINFIFRSTTIIRVVRSSNYGINCADRELMEFFPRNKPVIIALLSDSNLEIGRLKFDLNIFDESITFYIVKDIYTYIKM